MRLLLLLLQVGLLWQRRQGPAKALLLRLQKLMLPQGRLRKPRAAQAFAEAALYAVVGLPWQRRQGLVRAAPGRAAAAVGLRLPLRTLRAAAAAAMGLLVQCRQGPANELLETRRQLPAERATEFSATRTQCSPRAVSSPSLSPCLCGTKSKHVAFQGGHRWC